MAPADEGSTERGARGARRPRAVLGLSGGTEDDDRRPLFPLLCQNYPPALLAEAERVGCAFVAAWPPDAEELGMVVAQALARAPDASGGVAPPVPTLAQTLGRVIAVWGL